MKLAVSQIAWEPAEEAAALALLKQAGFAGLEIAPPRVAGEAPYGKPQLAAQFAQHIQCEYGLRVCSMQSIWYGQTGNMFGAQQPHFLAYTKAAIRFAQSCGAANLVFGNPKNRSLPDGVSPEAAVPFFEELGAYAAQRGTVLALEANPAVYGTNFMNTTPQAFAMAQRVQSAGVRVNLDFGTMLLNGEEVNTLRGYISLVNHVHISAPQLAAIQPQKEHKELAALLREEGYAGYVSVEMRAQPLGKLQDIIEYMAGVFA